MFKRLLTLVPVTVIVMSLSAAIAYADTRLCRDPDVVEFKPVQHPSGPGPVDLLFRFAPYRQLNDDEVIAVKVVRIQNLTYTGENEWSFRADPGEPCSTILHVDLPPDDTSGIQLYLDGGGGWYQCACYFVAKPDTVEFYEGYPMGKRGRSPRPQPDTTTYLVRMDLRDPVWKERMEKVWVPKNGPLVPAEDSGFFLFRMTMRHIEMSIHKGFSLQYKDSTGWVTPALPSDSTNPSPKSDSTSPQGNMETKADYQTPFGISLDSISGAVDDTTLSIDDTVQFFFRYYNVYGDTITGGTNGIRLYSWDGAWWNPPTDENTTKWLSSFTAWDQKYVNHFDCDGMGADTVGFGGFRIPPVQGMPPGFSERSFVITTHFDDPYNIGLHFCIDSCFYPPVNEWLWSSPGGGLVPDWAGPYCFVLSRNTIQFRGFLEFRDHRKSVPVYQPMRGIRIEWWEEEYHDSVLVASTEADDTGYFEFQPIINEDETGLPRDVFFKIHAANVAATVVDTVSADSAFYWQTPVRYDVPSGVYDTVFTAEPEGTAKYFFVADVMFEGHKRWQLDRPGDHYAAEAARVIVDELLLGSSYDPSTSWIYIQDAVSVAYRWPDTWDDATILHEQGHYIQCYLDFCDWNPGGFHTWWTRTHAGQAASEGFAHWWSAVVRQDPVKRNYGPGSLDFTWRNLEDGTAGDSGSVNTVKGTANALGERNEGAVAGIWWDIYDDADDDFSGSVDWGDSTLPHHPDGIGDTLSDGSTNTLSSLIDYYVKSQRGLHRPVTIDQFWATWFRSPSAGHDSAMSDIWYEHAVPYGCCKGIRGNVDGDEDDVVNIVDLTYMVEYMFGGGPVPPCWQEADLDSDMNVGIIDLTRVVNYLFAPDPMAPDDC